MSFFTKSKFKRGAGLGGINNQSLARISAEGPRAENEDALVLNIIETQTTQINELTYKLKLKESALEDCLQRKTQEVDQLKNVLRQQDRLLPSHIQDTRQELKKARMDWEIEQNIKQVNAFNCYERHTKELQDQLSKEKGESARLKDDIQRILEVVELLKRRHSEAQEQARLKHELELAEVRAVRDAAQSRAWREAKMLGEQLYQKGQRIHELDEQVQMQTETIDQTRLALNRTKNELTQEKRKARQAIEESATKSQQLEFVQQQCARLQEQLHDRTGTKRNKFSLR